MRLVPDACEPPVDVAGLAGLSAGVVRDAGDVARDRVVAAAVRKLVADGVRAVWCGGDRPLADTAAVVAQLDAAEAR